VDGKAPGNTQYVAMLIRQKTGGSLFRLEPVTPYPREHRALVSLAEKEQAGDIRPEIAVHPISRRMTRSSPDIPTGGPRYAHAPLHVPRAAGSLRQSHHSLLYPRGERVLPHHRDNPEKNSPAPECRRRVSLSAGRIWTQRRLAPQPGSEKPDTAFSSSQAASDGLNRKPQISTDTRIARKNASFQNEEKHMKPTNLLAVILLAAGLVTTSAAAAGAASQKPISIERQGTFSAGGTVIPAKEPYNPMKPTPEGQTLHGDHASVFYQIPVHARKYPLVFLHGAGQSMRTWQTTPDGREGFQNVFLRRGFGVYLVDQPRRGDAGRATVASTIEAKPDEQYWFGQFRIGVWPNVFRGSQFAQGDKAMDQFLRQMTPNTAPFDYGVISDAMAAVLEQSGPAILVTHSQGGGVGWLTALKSHNVKAIVSYEPGSGFLFPEGEVPDPIPNASAFGPFKAKGVPLSQFMALTKMPIVIYYGDNIPSEPVTEPHEDYWRAAMSMALKWAETVNRHGGDVTVVHLPDRGLHGNTHFPFSDRNSLQVADLLSRWLKAKKLD